MSESGVDSDKMRRGLSKSVRIVCGFGQNEKGTSKKCPNQIGTWIQTTPIVNLIIDVPTTDLFDYHPCYQ